MSGKQTFIYKRQQSHAAAPGVAARLGMFVMPLLILTASCVHDGRHVGGLPGPLPGARAQDRAMAALAPPDSVPLEATALRPISTEDAIAANVALPLSRLPDRGAATFVLVARTPVDQLRSLDCLAQAVYYEARSETEDGQRAVAQVVLNRMRHPGYPASVCGVVYQGPMRAGGGCQFTFTCDGSLTVKAAGPSWDRARRIAAEALSGHVMTAVGHATHYHTTAVFPFWAPSLVKSALIGSHIFYRFPGLGGSAGAFRQAYAGSEPLPVPTRILFRAPQVQLASLELPTRGVQAGPASTAATVSDRLSGVVLTDPGLPVSRIKEAYRNSGRIREKPVITASIAEPQPGLQ